MGELWPYLALLAGRRGRLVFGGLLLLLTTVAGTGLLALSGWFITATAVTAGLWAVGTMVAFDVYVPGGGIRAFALTRTAARYGERLYNHDTVLRVLADLRGAVFARLAALDSVTLARFRSADLLSRLTADIDALDALYLRALAPPAVALAMIAALTGLFTVFMPLAGGVVGAWLLLAWVGLLVSGWVGGAAMSEAAAHYGAALRVRVIEQVDGLGELITFRTLTRHRAETARTDDALAAVQRRLAQRSAAGEALAALGVQGAAVAALLLGVWGVQQGRLDVAVAVLIALAPLGLGELFGALPAGLLQLGRARASARRLTAQTATRSAVRDAAYPQPMPTGNAVGFHEVAAAYGRGEDVVLRGLDFMVAEGERVAVLGPSGSGKSTVADLLARCIDPSAGRVTLGGVSLADLPLAGVRQRVAYLTQRTDVFDDTVAANLRIARPDAGARALWHALNVAELDEFAAALPQGLETPLGQGGAGVSGGQARRLALARVVLRDAPVVILDEPLAGLDAATSARVSERLDHWLTGRTVVLLAHQAGVLPPHDRTLRLPVAHRSS